MLRKLLPTVAFVAGLAFTVGTADAQTVNRGTYYETEDDAAAAAMPYRGAPAPGPAPIARQRYEAPVYGWSYMVPARPSCGVFRYWDGEKCLDARDVPPNLE
jgi:hypothetical protein